MRQRQGFCTVDNPRAWLFQVARNALVDRSRTTHPTDPLSEDAPITTPVRPSWIPSTPLPTA